MTVPSVRTRFLLERMSEQLELEDLTPEASEAWSAFRAAFLGDDPKKDDPQDPDATSKSKKKK